MTEINWDEAPEGFPIWIEATDGLESSGWHAEEDWRYVDQSGAFWSKPQDGLYRVYRKSEGNLMQKNFAICDKVLLISGHKLI